MKYLPILFTLSMAILAVIDWKLYMIPNWLIMPLIAICALKTGYWQWALIMFAIGAGLFGFQWSCAKCGHIEVQRHNFSLHRGGDVKLFALIGAMAGWKALLICAIGYGLIFLYRAFLYIYAEGLPVTPFMFVPFAVLIWF